MTAQDHLHTLVREYTRRVWNEHDVSALDDFAPDSTLFLGRAEEEKYVDRDTLKARVHKVLVTMPDHRLDITTIVTQGDSVIFQWVNSGHWTDGDRGSFPVRFGGMTYWRVEEGRVAARDGIADVTTFAWQTGVLPPRRRIRLLMPI